MKEDQNRKFTEPKHYVKKKKAKKSIKPVQIQPIISNEIPEIAQNQQQQNTQSVGHCCCGNPNEYGIMISCDSCERWYHIACVNIEEVLFLFLG